jgi:radical SAM protein with 4Fe4S-binding SPASM domain
MVRKGGTMKRWVFEKILHDAKEINISEIVLFLCGEPFLFPDLFVWLQRLREEKCTTAIFTNAQHLNSAKAEKLVEYSDVVHTIVFSIAGINEATHMKIMGLSYPTVVKNIEYFTQINNSKIRVLAHIPKMEATEPFLDEWTQTWRSALGEASPTPMFNYAGLVRDDLELRVDDLHARDYCDRLNHLMILWDGRVCLCCWDAEGTTILGNVKERSLSDIFYSEVAYKYRTWHKLGKYDNIPICQECNANILLKEDIEARRCPC